MMSDLFTESQYDIIGFCAKECELQGSGEMSVAWMVDAWSYASDVSDRVPTIEDILELGALVEPHKNVAGFRRVGVRVGWDVKMPPAHVWGAMVSLIENMPRLSAKEFFFEYENVHPFVDGNGRTGAVIFNWLRGSLNEPVWPPNFWNDPGRVGLKMEDDK